MAGISRGFTLIEALVALALVALLISLGIPAMSGLIRSYQLRTASQALIISLNKARQASVTMRVPVLVDNEDENWSAGWRVYADRNDNARWDEGEPILMEVGDADGTVDWHQGIEFYNFARRAGRKDFVLLVYPGEDHGLRKKENQIDYHRRIQEWFGHYLKGEPAPKWMSEGMPWLERKARLDGQR